MQNKREVQMKVSQNLKLVGISLLLVAGLSACEKPGPAETAGKKIDQQTDEANKKIHETTANVGVVIDDAEITTKVKAAIFAEPSLKSLQISVITQQGVVTLSGSADSQSISDLIRGLAGAVAGVKEVKNNLVLKPKK
jgi:osmotically-inducible protein OsmY